MHHKIFESFWACCAGTLAVLAYLLVCAAGHAKSHQAQTKADAQKTTIASSTIVLLATLILRCCVVQNLIKSRQEADIQKSRACVWYFGSTRKSHSVWLQGVRNLIKAGQEAGIQKVVLLSSFGVGCFPLNLFIGVSPFVIPAHASRDDFSYFIHRGIDQIGYSLLGICDKS